MAYLSLKVKRRASLNQALQRSQCDFEGVRRVPNPPYATPTFAKQWTAKSGRNMMLFVMSHVWTMDYGLRTAICRLGTSI